LTITDGAPGLVRAVETCFPRTLRRPLVHRLRNLGNKAPDSPWPPIAIRARACSEAASPALATLLRDDFVQAYERELPACVKCFLEDFDTCNAHLRFPLRHRKVHSDAESLGAAFPRGSTPDEDHPARLRRAAGAEDDGRNGDPGGRPNTEAIGVSWFARVDETARPPIQHHGAPTTGRGRKTPVIPVVKSSAAELRTARSTGAPDQVN
jgi:hypothetical protein